MIKTVTLTGSEVKVTDLGGQNAAVKNLGSGSIYVSTKPNITAGADNVIEIPAGAGEVVLDTNGTVYIVGTGKVQCTGTPYAVPNFKLPSSSSGGGGGTSDVTKEYVDAQDATNLSLAKAYTDNSKAEIQTTIDTIDNTLNTHIADQVKHITAEERTAWNAVNYSNPNLLINPDFRINQRGLTKYTGTDREYTVDRWQKAFQYLPTSGDVVVTTSESGSITITNSTDKFVTFTQKVENPRFLYGKTVTASARIDGVTYMAIGTVLTTGKGTILRSESGSKFYFTVYQDCSIERFDFEIHIVSGVTATIDWAKLELGSIATPFCPPDLATELAKCQRYFYRLGGLKNNFVLQGWAYSPTSMSFTYQFPVEMRTLPTLSVSKGNWRFCIQKIPYEGSRYWNNEYGFVFSVDANFSYSQRVGINVNFDDTKSTSITAGDPVIIKTNSDSDSSGNQKYPGWLDFDAEL